MRFMMLIKSDAQTEAGIMPSAEVFEAMGKFNDELIAAGAMLGGEGFKASAKGLRVHQRKSEISVQDGPLAAPHEVVAGYWILSVKSREEAVAWAKRVPCFEGEVELREIFELEDFPVDASERPGGWREVEADARNAAPPARIPGTKRFVVLLQADAATESGLSPKPEVLEEMGAFMQELTQSGALLGGEGLKPSSSATKVRFTAGKPSLVDGPFTESKELVAGFSIVQVKTKQEAVVLAKRLLDIHVRGTGVEKGTVELREPFEIEDFAA
jgi:hypothetical protein